jgi:hypothetical protein
MKRLFEVIQSSGKSFNPPLYFRNKQMAKIARGKLTDLKTPERKIVLGPDHRRYQK